MLSPAFQKAAFGVLGIYFRCAGNLHAIPNAPSDCMPCLLDLVVLSLRRRLACRTTDSLTPTGGEEILFFQTMHIFLP